MKEGAWFKVGAASGIATVVIQVIGIAIHGYPKNGASKSELQSWITATDETRFAIGIYVEAIGILLLIVFAAWIYTLLRGSDRVRWLALSSLGSALVWVAMGISINEIWFSVLKAGKAGVASDVVLVIRDLAQDSFNISNLPFGLFVLTTGAAAIVTKTLHPWLGWSAVVLGVAIFIPPLSLPGSLLFFLWIPLLCGLAIARRHAPANAPS